MSVCQAAPTSPMSSSKFLEEAFRLPSFDLSDSASISIIDLSCSDRTMSSIGKSRQSSYLSLDLALDRSALSKQRKAAGELSLICERRIDIPCSRSLSASTHARVKKSRRHSTRASYNFHMGLLTHCESNQINARSCGIEVRDSATRSSTQAHDELWDLLLH